MVVGGKQCLYLELVDRGGVGCNRSLAYGCGW